MTDIVERLRAEAESCRDVCNELETANCMRTAADEIDRLRAAIVQIYYAKDDISRIRNIAQAALGEAP